MGNPLKYWLLFSICFMLMLQLDAQTKTATPSADTAKKAAPKPGITEKTKGSKKVEGLLTIYQDTATGSVQLYIRKDQLGKEFIYQSFSMGGPAQLFLNQNMIRITWVFKIQKAFDRIEFAQENTNFYYDPANAVSKAANVDVGESVFYSDKVAAEDSTGYLINADALFLSDKLDPIKPTIPPNVPPTAIFNLGNLNVGKSKYDKIRSFPKNTDVVVDLAFDNPMPMNFGGKDITDARYTRIRFQHTFLEMPDNDYKPRRDDPRIGYFSQEIDDQTSKSATPYHDLINRWNLKKKDPTAAISEPVEPIVWWVENTTPVELRQTIVDAGLKWNEAFEKAGFKNAVVMKIMPDTATWDPADVRYNVIRWVSSNLGYAIGPSFVNPKTGQILGSDITIDYMFVPIISDESDLFGHNSETLSNPNPLQSPIDFLPKQQVWKNCNFAKQSAMQFAAAQTALELDGAGPNELSELQKQFFTELVMHEMGHTLGLNHNMKASTMLSPAELKDKSITDELGVMGSVMDYSAVNVSLDPAKQAGYYTAKPGPYDNWAIEYGYTECKPAEEETVLTKILSRSNDPKLTFGNDADITGYGSGIDPRVQTWDMSNDMATYADERYRLVNSLMVKLKDKYVKPGQSYQELSSRYFLLNRQRFQMSIALSRYIGGIYVDRSFPEQKSTSKPFTPVPVDYQKKVLAVISKYIFAPNAFNADSYLFPYLQRQRRGYNFFGMTEDPKPQNLALSLQMNVLNFVLYPTTMQRISTSGLYGNTYSVADVLNDLNSDIFSEDLKTNVNLYRQNLQTEYVKKLTAIVTMPISPYDNPSKSAAYNALRKIRTVLGTAVSPNEQTRAHRANLIFQIDKALVVK
ncbi:MAG: zinc-dependent metalloprotease [Bacteroidetes bacterium]|nr:zinc-dependent metalloprotease [Bacteroidota bacterium]